MLTSQKEVWVCAAVYYDNLDALLAEAAIPTANQILQEGVASRFMFNRSWKRGKNVLLLFKTSKDNNQKLKSMILSGISKYLESYPAPEKEIEMPVNDWFLPFPNNHIDYNDIFIVDIMETGGLQASIVAEELLSASSDMVLTFIREAEEGWNAESAIGTAIQVHLGLMGSFGMNLKEISAFYSLFFNNILQMTQGADDSESFKTSLITGLNENFQEQKEGVVGFIEYFLNCLMEGESFEEEWINSWVKSCRIASEDLIRLQSSNHFMAPESLVIDNSIGVDPLIQEKWPVMEYYLRAINSQMGITDIFELNLIYSIKESVKCLLEAQEA